MENKGNKSRTFIILLLFIILAVTSAVRIATLAVDRKGKYSDPVVSSKNVRGTVYDRHGNLLSFDSTEEGFLILDSVSSQQAASLISSYTSLSPLEIAAELDEGKVFFPIPEGTEASRALGEIVEKGLVSLVTITRKSVRKHPYSFMNEILGEEGEGGIEEMFNSYLSAVPTLNETEVYGEDLVLTIDMDYEKLLSSILSSLGYTGECALLNRKGEIIAWYGEVNDSLLSSLCYSHSTSEATLLFQRSEYISIEDCLDISSFHLWMSEENEAAVISIRKALGDYS